MSSKQKAKVGLSQPNAKAILFLNGLQSTRLFIFSGVLGAMVVVLNAGYHWFY